MFSRTTLLLATLVCITGVFSFTSSAQAAIETVSLIRQDCTGYTNCYTSLFAWEAAKNKDLVAADEIAVARIEGVWTSPDTSRLSINGWATDATHYIKIYTAPDARHDGKWNTMKYRLEPSSSGDSILIYNPYVTIEGLQIGVFGGAAIRNANTVSGEFSYSHNLLRGDSSNYKKAIYTDYPGVFKIFNNVIYDFTGLESTGIYIYSPSASAYIYNNTLVSNSVGIYARQGTVIAKNNLIKGSSNTLSYNGVFSAGTDYNSTDSTDAIGQGLNNRISQTFTFLDTINKDFHLASSDMGAKDVGSDLSIDSNLSFVTDIDGATRSAPYDIGADESSEGATTPPPDTLAPTVPAGLITTVTSSSQINLSWIASTDNVAVTGYRIYRNGTQVATSVATAYSDTGLTAATAYTYSVAAYDAAGNSSVQSASVNGTTLVAVVADTTPPIISSISTPLIGVSSVTITWNTNEPSDTQVEYGATTSYGALTPLDTTLTTAHTYVLTGLISNTTYNYRVISKDAAGNSTTSGNGVFTTTSTSLALTSTEGLDEIMTRKARLATNTFSSGEGLSSPYYWRPQTLMYRDINTDREVWRLSNTRSGIMHRYHNDIALQPWSADGKRLGYLQTMLSAQGMSTAAYAGEEGWNAWFILNTDGSRNRPIPGSPIVCSGATVFPWSQKYADTFHAFGDTHCGNSSVSIDTLYRGTVSDTGVTRTPLLNFGTGIQMAFYSPGFSSDGLKAMVTQSYLPDRYAYKIWPVTLYPTPTIDVVGGYTTNRPHDGTYWGTSPLVWSTAHSLAPQLINLNGSGEYRYYWVDSYAQGTAFLTKLFGSESDGGAGHTIDHSGPWVFSDFGENVPIMVGSVGNNPWPGGHYWSHSAFDQWGKYAAYSDSNDPLPHGLSVENISTKVRLTTKQGGTSVQHNSWSGWSDYVVSTRGAGFDKGCLALGYTNDAKYANDSIYIKKYDANSAFTKLVSTHTLFNNDGCYAGAGYEYTNLPRPAQSPDGTKVAFHSTFTTAKVGAYDNNPDIFWTVAQYPYPPEIKSAVKNGSTVHLVWDFNQGTASSPNHINPRTYTKRGWPNEVTDRPAAPREIKQFRVWSSLDNLTWSPVGTVTYNNCSSTNECGLWTESSWGFDVMQSNNSVRYYAVTSVEQSGLESRSLSNVWKVTIDAGGNITAQIQQTNYPTDPGGKIGFLVSAPGAPYNVSVTHKQPPASANGQYTISWHAPADSSLIRYYNIYAHDGSTPAVIQQARIASIPAASDYDADNNFSYVDWLGNIDGSTQYLVTAVDYQGNESGVIVGPLVPDTTPPTTPTSLTTTSISASQINLSWTASSDNTAVTGYRIYRNGTELTTVTTSSYSNTGLSPSTSYTYTVAAYDAAGNTSSQSTSASGSTQNAPVITPPTTTPTLPPSTIPTTPSASGATGSISIATPTTTVPTVSTPTSRLSLTRNLYRGTKGTDVKSLQTFLIQQGHLAPTSDTGFYGPLTKQAVEKYQCARSLVCSGTEVSTGYGVVGPKTRAALNSATVSAGTTTTFTTNLTPAQVDAILSVLASFGAEQAIVEQVRRSLGR